MTTMDSAQAGGTTTTPPAAGPPPAPNAALSRWLDVAVGAALQAEDVAIDLAAGLRRAAERRERWIGELAERGAAQRARGRLRAAAAARSAVTVVATSVPVNLVVDAQLERVLRPVVRVVLDDVLLLLEQEPERIQSLIRGQRESMVDEVVGRIRTGAAAGDTAVERLTSRMFHRNAVREPLTAPSPADRT
jgi:hypothetical protein